MERQPVYMVICWRDGAYGQVPYPAGGCFNHVQDGIITTQEIFDYVQHVPKSEQVSRTEPWIYVPDGNGGGLCSHQNRDEQYGRVGHAHPVITACYLSSARPSAVAVPAVNQVVVSQDCHGG